VAEGDLPWVELRSQGSQEVRSIHTLVDGPYLVVHVVSMEMPALSFAGGILLLDLDRRQPLALPLELLVLGQLVL